MTRRSYEVAPLTPGVIRLYVYGVPVAFVLSARAWENMKPSARWRYVRARKTWWARQTPDQRAAIIGCFTRGEVAA